MPAHKSNIVRDVRLNEIAKRYLRGERLVEIAQAVGIHRNMVRKDLELIERQWVEARLFSIDQYKGRELAKVDHLEATYWTAWEASCLPKESTVTGRSTHSQAVNPALTQETTSAAIRREPREGNPLYLQGVQWCINKRCELLGLNAPRKLAHVDSEGNTVAPIVEYRVMLAPVPSDAANDEDGVLTDPDVIEMDPAS